MAQFIGDARDAKRARYGARVQEEMKEAFERKVQEMRDETDNSLNNMQLGRMFSTDESLSQQQFTDATVGLQTHEEYKHKAAIYLNPKTTSNHSNSDPLTTVNGTNTLSPSESNGNGNESIIEQTAVSKTKHTLSFGDDSDISDESEDTNQVPIRSLKRKLDSVSNSNSNSESNLESKSDSISTGNRIKRRKLIHKNPNVNTSFLPDPERDIEDERLRAELEKEWFERQQIIKRERLEITYSYWDGSGHRRSIEIQKGISIGEFLELVRKELSSQFSELRGISGEYLMYIKDDLIIPHSYKFYDLIVTKSRGKSGWEMFKSLGSRDKESANRKNVVDKDGGHPGKVITRSWYDRNKHIFPASRWEVYDPQTHAKAD